MVNQMKFLAALLLIGATTAPAFAGGPVYHGHKSIHYEKYCYKNVEKYIPGYYNEYGRYVGGYVKNNRKKVPCRRQKYVPRSTPNFRHKEQHPNVGSADENSCVEGSILGGILGGGAGAAASRGDGRLWAIPLGIVSGAMVGCQVDGG